MKKLLLCASLLSAFFATAQEDYTQVTIPLQPGYANQVFFDFSSNTQTAVAANTWDIAFLRISSMSIGTRVNDSRGIRVFEASANVNDWASIDVTGEAEWTELYNSETTWLTGAFDTGSAPYGWGAYNPATHHVSGTVVFVLKYADNTYKKFMIEDYFGGYTIKYATWNGTEWSADETAVIPNAGGEGYTFNFFSLDTDQTVTVAPTDTDWDLAFGRYYGNVGTNEEPAMYLVTGALHNAATVTVAQADETGATTETPSLPADETYSEDINIIGDDWKSFNMGTFTYDIDPETTFYVKQTDGTVYRMYFTAFGGTGTGTLSFNYKNITATAGIEDVNENMSFGLYPNPASDKNVTLIYDIKNSTANKNTVSIYAVTGAKVFETEVTADSGFYTKQLNLSQLNSGIYVVQMQSGSYTQSKKLVIR
jgi:hypothetical protein